ncbi:MAG: HEAT repeat domain-containing protein [Candidatus Riflebacteria bacterium]|nr:HEAT repeat domain-containing protein [Candidatus Riflebacteria bacterium]
MSRSTVGCVVALLLFSWPVGAPARAATGGRPARAVLTSPSPIARDEGQGLYAFAVGAAVVGRIDDAIRAVEQHLRQLPTDAAAWNLEGLLIAPMNQAAAVRALRRSLELDGTMACTWGNLALALYRQGEARALEETLRLARQGGVEDPVLTLVRARLRAAVDPSEGRVLLRRAADEARESGPVLASMVQQEVDADLQKLERALAARLDGDVSPDSGWVDKRADQVEWLARIDPIGASRVLGAAWEKRPGRQRFGLSLIYLKLGWPATVTLMERGLTDADPDVRGVAATSLGSQHALAAVPRIREALARETHVPARWCMVEALARLEDSSGLRELLALAKNTPDPKAAQMAVLHLPLLVADEVIPALVEALHHPRLEVRRPAHWSLETLANTICPCGPRIGSEICQNHFGVLLEAHPDLGRHARPRRTFERTQRGLTAMVLKSRPGSTLSLGTWGLGDRFVFVLEELRRAMPDQNLQVFEPPGLPPASPASDVLNPGLRDKRR